jgi:hypothetical protein
MINNCLLLFCNQINKFTMSNKPMNRINLVMISHTLFLNNLSYRINTFKNNKVDM